MRKLILILAVILLLCPTPALAWGPTAHENIGQTATDWLVTDNSAFQAGVVMVDVARARSPAQPTEHTMFHAPAYSVNLKTMATTPELKAFVHGYQTHLASDLVQNAYGNVDEAVDAILGTGPIHSITLTNAEADLMVAAWVTTYPAYSWQPDRAWILAAQIAFNFYLRYNLYTQAQHDAALLAWPGYQTYLTLSAKNSLDAIVKRGDALIDGVLNMGDVIYIERVILTMSPRNAEADANGDWAVDMGDVIWVMRKILGY